MKHKHQETREKSKRRRDTPKPKAGKPGSPPTPHGERLIDESLGESFPASDPPAHSTVSDPLDDLIQRGED